MWKKQWSNGGSFSNFQTNLLQLKMTIYGINCIAIEQILLYMVLKRLNIKNILPFIHCRKCNEQ